MSVLLAGADARSFLLLLYLPPRRVATGKMAGEVLKLLPVSGGPSKVDDDAQSEWVASDAGEVFSEQVGGSSEVSGGRGVDHFDVVAFPVRSGGR